MALTLTVSAGCSCPPFSYASFKRITHRIHPLLLTACPRPPVYPFDSSGSLTVLQARASERLQRSYARAVITPNFENLARLNADASLEVTAWSGGTV